ncbi:hypothetical protein ACLKA6_002106 [Drosophila palustris]
MPGRIICYELLVSLGAAPAGSSVLRESPIPGPQFIATDNSPIHKTAVDIRNFTTLSQQDDKSTAKQQKDPGSGSRRTRPA